MMRYPTRTQARRGCAVADFHIQAQLWQVAELEELNYFIFAVKGYYSYVTASDLISLNHHSNDFHIKSYP